MQGIGDVFNALFILLPWWVLVLLGVVGAALALPGWWKNTRLKPLASRIREMAMADTAAERDALMHSVLDTAGDDGDLLAWVILQAEKRKQRPLWEAAMAQLEQLPKFTDEARRLHKRWTKDIPPPRHPIEEAAAIRAKLEDGLLVAARDRLDAALARFPQDHDLLEALVELEALEAERATDQ